MKFFLVLVFTFFAHHLKGQDTIPYENKDSYKFELDYNFKSKPVQDREEINFEQKRSSGNTLLPYVKVLITLTNMPEDRYKVRITNDLGNKVLTKKIKKNMQIVVDMGYADDIKDGVGPHKYDIIFEDKEKKKLSKIVLDIDRDGNFWVNEQRFGKI